MAEKVTSESAAASGHNLAQVNATILHGFKRIYSLDEQIAAMMEQYVQPLRDEKNKVKRNLKADTDIHWNDMKPHFDLYKRSKQVRAFEDEEEGRKSQDALRIVADAMYGEGDQLDFVAMLERIDTAPDPVSQQEAA